MILQNDFATEEELPNIVSVDHVKCRCGKPVNLSVKVHTEKNGKDTIQWMLECSVKCGMKGILWENQLIWD